MRRIRGVRRVAEREPEARFQHVRRRLLVHVHMRCSAVAACDDVRRTRRAARSSVRRAP